MIIFYRNELSLNWAAPDVVEKRLYKQVAELDTDDLERAFRMMNVVDGDELPVQLKVRSMSCMKCGIHVYDDEGTCRVFAVYDRAMAERAVGWVCDDGNCEFAERLTGWTYFSGGAGRAFADEPDVTVYGKKIIVRQRRGLDI